MSEVYRDTLINCLIDVFGTTGFWLGFSVITAFEFLLFIGILIKNAVLEFLYPSMRDIVYLCKTEYDGAYLKDKLTPRNSNKSDLVEEQTQTGLRPLLLKPQLHSRSSSIYEKSLSQTRDIFIKKNLVKLTSREYLESPPQRMIRRATVTSASLSKEECFKPPEIHKSKIQVLNKTNSILKKSKVLDIQEQIPEDKQGYSGQTKTFVLPRLRIRQPYYIRNDSVLSSEFSNDF